MTGPTAVKKRDVADVISEIQEPQTFETTDDLANAVQGDMVKGDDNLDLIVSQIARMDKQRLEAAAALINVFNFAIQVQANRNEWKAEDYLSFVLAMRAVDSIGSNAIAEARTKITET